MWQNKKQKPVMLITNEYMRQDVCNFLYRGWSMSNLSQNMLWTTSVTRLTCEPCQVDQTYIEFGFEIMQSMLLNILWTTQVCLNFPCLIYEFLIKVKREKGRKTDPCWNEPGTSETSPFCTKLMYHTLLEFFMESGSLISQLGFSAVNNPECYKGHLKF